MEYKHKVFCDEYVKYFDFNASCTVAKVNKNKIRALMYDETSQISKYLREQVDTFALANTFITNDFIKFKLGQVIITAKAPYKISAAKVLLGYDDNVDKTSEFLSVIRAMKE